MYIIHAVLCLIQLLVMFDSLWPHGLQPARLLCPWGFSRQEYWSGLPCPPPRDLINPGMEPRFPAFQADSLQSEPPGKLSLSIYIHTHTHTHIYIYTHIHTYLCIMTLNVYTHIDTDWTYIYMWVYICVRVFVCVCVCVGVCVCVCVCDSMGWLNSLSTKI